VKRAPSRTEAPALDVAIALVLTAWIEIDVFVRDSVAGPELVVGPLLALQALPLIWRRRTPLLVVAVSMAAGAAHAIATGEAPEGGPGFLAMLVALYSVGAYASTRRAVVGLAVVAIAYVIHELNNPNIETEAQVWSALFAAAITAIVFSVGVYVRRYRLASELERRAELLEREREERAHAAVAEERARIARELHDIVSHNVSVMVVQAEAAEEVLEKQPARAGEPLRRIQRTGREALAEMRRMLGVLRDGEGSALAPQPSLGNLDALVAQMSEAGVPVSLRIEGDARPLPAGIELTAYRVVQEALTNTLRHAGPTQVDVVLRHGDGQIEIEVIDGGRGSASVDGSGQGLVGMQERVRLYGGSLEAGPRAEGGFRVRATLPAP
jgi:signal transduction histidine kinase